MEKSPANWASRDRERVYRELDHPADLLLQIEGEDLPELFENALFALYDELAVLDDFQARRELSISASGSGPAEALRALLAEALYRFDTDRFVAVGAEVSVRATVPSGHLQVTAVLSGENADKHRHGLLTEIKAVTYHQLSAAQRDGDGWRATVLFDV